MGRAVAIVLGSANAALEDLAAALALAPDAGVICVNDALRTCPVKASAFATLHPEKHKRFLDGLEVEGLPLFTSEPQSYAKRHWTIVREKWSGTSGLYAAQIALDALGFSRVIVAGVPIDHKAGTSYKRQDGKPWANGYESRYQRGWTKALPHIQGRVRSMSGWTRDLLGAPSPEWISGLSATA